METSGKPHAPNALLRYPTNRKMGGPQSRVERFAQEKNSCPSEIRTPDDPSINLIAVPTELSRLLREKSVQNCKNKI
jgi:hypothetical protein